MDNGSPWPIIAFRSIPTSFIRTVPIAMVKKNIYLNIGNKVDICPGYKEYGRRCRNHQEGWQRNIYPNMDIYFGNGSI
jgi:hypothetical protein